MRLAVLPVSSSFPKSYLPVFLVSPSSPDLQLPGDGPEPLQRERILCEMYRDQNWCAGVERKAGKLQT